jgi:hypothetical protein
MQSTDPIDAREEEIAKIAKSEKDTASLQQHLNEMFEGTAFKGSHRSGQFLKYIVDQALAGHFEWLKERVIGVELFGRSTTYDTGEDAIVRVTASDVRKRLLQHYGKYGVTSEFRISLPLGSYIPEITRNGHAAAHVGIEPHPQSSGVHHESVAPPRDFAVPQSEPVVLPAVLPVNASPSKSPSRSLWPIFGVLFLVLNLGLWGTFWSRSSRPKAASMATLPWSAFFNPSHATHLITSDPNMVVVQEITGGQLSVSDYANHKYIPEPNKLTPEEIRFCHVILWGDYSAAAVDPPITASIAALAQASSGKIDVRAARNIRLSDLKTDDGFILLGSPRSNPWSALFGDTLDFKFVFDKVTRQEVILNVHPRPNELPAYVPTALGWATGQSFAIIAFIQNPDREGHVLLLAGANGEGTEAVGRLASDPSHLSPMLKKCGIDPSGQVQHFELLLHLNTMAGSTNELDMVACHILPGASIQKP